MKRHSYIIKGHSKNSKEEQAFITCVNKYFDFLRSIAGGAWETEELSKLETPTSQELKTIIESHNPDYALIIFVGHGATQDNNQLFGINEEEVIKAGQFVLNVPKQMIILESCRGNGSKRFPVIDLSDKPPEFERGGIVRAPISRNKAKELFFKELSRCDKGLVVCFACSPDESAWGFLFTQVLLNFGMAWHLNPDNHLQVLKINSLIEFSVLFVTEAVKVNFGEKQTPQKTGEANFPFCISKF